MVRAAPPPLRRTLALKDNDDAVGRSRLLAAIIARLVVVVALVWSVAALAQSIPPAPRTWDRTVLETCGYAWPAPVPRRCRSLKPITMRFYLYLPDREPKRNWRKRQEAVMIFDAATLTTEVSTQIVCSRVQLIAPVPGTACTPYPL